MKLKKLRIKPREDGANLVELALVMFFLILLLIGISDFGRAFNNYIIITNAAREAARFASHFPAEETEIKNAAIREAESSGIALEADDIAILTGLNGAAGDPIRVEVEYTFETFFGGLVGFNTLTLRSATEMVIYGLD